MDAPAVQPVHASDSHLHHDILFGLIAFALGVFVSYLVWKFYSTFCLRSTSKCSSTDQCVAPTNELESPSSSKQYVLKFDNQDSLNKFENGTAVDITLQTI